MQSQKVIGFCLLTVGACGTVLWIHSQMKEMNMKTALETIQHKDMQIEQAFIEPGKCENGSLDDDPYGASSPENILKYLKGEEFDGGDAYKLK